MILTDGTNSRGPEAGALAAGLAHRGEADGQARRRRYGYAYARSRRTLGVMLVHRRAVASGLGVGLTHVRAMFRVPVIARAREMVNPRLRVDLIIRWVPWPTAGEALVTIGFASPIGHTAVQLTSAIVVTGARAKIDLVTLLLTGGKIGFATIYAGVTLHEILRLGRFFAFAAGNSETRTDSSLEFAANVRMPDERRRAV